MLRAHVVVKTLNLASSRRCFAQYGKEMYKMDPARAARLFFVIIPIVLWRCRFRSRGHFLNSLLKQQRAQREIKCEECCTLQYSF